MGFLQDLGSFINDVNSLGDEIDNLKQDVVATVVDGATQVQGTLSDVKDDVVTTAGDIQDTVKQATDLSSAE